MQPPCNLPLSVLGNSQVPSHRFDLILPSPTLFLISLEPLLEYLACLLYNASSIVNPGPQPPTIRIPLYGHLLSFPITACPAS